MGGIEYVYWPGTTTRLTPWMLYCLTKLDADLRKNFGVHLTLNSSDVQRGIRTYQEQVDLFLSRYRVQWFGSGPFGDVRTWQGKRYVRHSGLGTVAQPGTSNHEIQGGYYAAVDLADSGDAGIGTMNSHRSNWLRANAHWYGLEPEGFKFKEAWHYRVPGIFQTPPVSPVAPISYTLREDEDMANPIAYVKGNKAPETYAVYLTAEANNPDAELQGGVYCARRHVLPGELKIALANGYEVQTIPQAELDDLPKVYGSK